MQVIGTGVPLPEDVPNSPLKVGDRVTRQLEIGGRQLRHGTVARVYRSTPDCQGSSYVLYAVKWDDTGNTDIGYFSIGLTREDLTQ